MSVEQNKETTVLTSIVYEGSYNLDPELSTCRNWSDVLARLYSRLAMLYEMQAENMQYEEPGDYEDESCSQCVRFSTNDKDTALRFDSFPMWFDPETEDEDNVREKFATVEEARAAISAAKQAREDAVEDIKVDTSNFPYAGRSHICIDLHGSRTWDDAIARVSKCVKRVRRMKRDGLIFIFGEDENWGYFEFATDKLDILAKYDPEIIELVVQRQVKERINQTGGGTGI